MHINSHQADTSRSFRSSVSPRSLTVRGLTAWKAKRLRLYIEARLEQRLDMSELANVVYLSRSHFCRSFKKTFGISAHRYIIHRRIELAQRLMLTTSTPLSIIAATCGMSDHSHLARLFRRVVGEAPSVWRSLHADTSSSCDRRDRTYEYCSEGVQP